MTNLISVAAQGLAVTALTRSGQRVPYTLEALYRMQATSASTIGGLSAEYRDIVLLQVTGRPFARVVAADAALEATPAGSHVVSSAFPISASCSCTN